MGNYKDIAYVFTVFAVELLKLIPLMICVFGFRIKPAKKITGFCLAAVAFLVISALTGVYIDIPAHVFIVIILTILVVDGKNRVLYTLSTYLGVCISDMLVATIWILISGRQYVDTASGKICSIVINSVGIIITALVCVISKVVFSRHKLRPTQSINKKYLFLIILGEVSLLAFITAFQTNVIGEHGRYESVMAVLLSAGSIVFLIICVALMANYISVNHYKNISEMNVKLAQVREQYYSMLLENENATRKFRHDVGNHINCMNVLLEEGEYDELKKYLLKLGASVDLLRPAVKTGNSVINAIISGVLSKYSEVEFIVEGKMPDDISISNTDLCTIFYNLFNNAFTVAQNADVKKVSATIKLLGNNLHFILKNTVNHKVIITGNRLTTDKHDKISHGYGSVNATECAESLGGSLMFRCSDTEFTAELILPNIIM